MKRLPGMQASDNFDRPLGAYVEDTGKTPYVPRKSSRNGALAFEIALFVCVFGATIFICRALLGSLHVGSFILALILALAASSSIHIALNWEKVVVLRLGKVHRVAGPGLYVTIPLIEFGTIRVDQRTITTPFSAKATLTADLVPVDIDAVLFWVVRDPQAACLEVEDYYAAVSYLAQAALREAVGRSTVAEVALRRDELDVEIKQDIDRQASEWGIDIIVVKVRDIVLPSDLQEVMSLEAQADRERNARIAVASAEVDMAEMLEEAARIYGDREAALKLRTMLLQYDTVKRSKSSVVSLPTALSDGFTGGSSRGVSDTEVH